MNNADFSSSSSSGAFGYESNNANGFDTGALAGGDAARASFYDASSFSSTGDVSGLSGGYGNLGGSSYESSSYRRSIGGGGGGYNSAFTAADTNHDGVLSPSEFRNAGY